MKYSSVLVAAIFCSALFSANVVASDRDKKHHADRGDRNHREYRDQRHDRDSRHRREGIKRHHGHRDHDSRHRHQRHDYGHRHHRNNDKRRYSTRNRNSEYFIGGLILGSLGHSYYNDRYYNNHYYNSGSHRGFRVSYWRDRYGDCYRIEHRRHGKVYTEVPRYKCY